MSFSDLQATDEYKNLRLKMKLEIDIWLAISWSNPYNGGSTLQARTLHFRFDQSLHPRAKWRRWPRNRPFLLGCEKALFLRLGNFFHLRRLVQNQFLLFCSTALVDRSVWRVPWGHLTNHWIERICNIINGIFFFF